LTFQITVPKRLTTTNTIKQSQADYTLKNPLDRKTFVTKIELIPNYLFAEKGDVIVLVNGVSVFDSSLVTAFFSDLHSIDVSPESNTINRSEKIEVFIWNNTDTDKLAITVNISFSDENIPPPTASRVISRSEKNRGVHDEGTKTTADGGSGIVSTVYTCPSGFTAKVLVFESRVKDTGSASQVRLLIRGTRIQRWQDETGNPEFLGNVGIMSDGARKSWSDGSFPEWNLTRIDLVDEELDEDETIAYDGDFSGNFNATIDFAYTILETRKA